MFAVDPLQALAPKKRKAFPSSWLSQFDFLGFDEKRGTMHLMFILMKLWIKIGVQNPCTPISLFVPQLYLSRGTKKNPFKNFSGHTGKR